MIIKITNINKIETSNGTIDNSDILIEDGTIIRIAPEINFLSNAFLRSALTT